MENRNTRRTGIERLQDYRENRNTEKTGIQGEQECTEKKNTREQKYMENRCFVDLGIVSEPIKGFGFPDIYLFVILKLQPSSILYL